MRYSRWILVCCLFLAPLLTWGHSLSVSDILSHEVDGLTLRFQNMSEPSTSISEIHLHFLQSQDCQSGYLATYSTASEDPGFLIAAQQPFGLLARSLYQTAFEALANASTSFFLKDIHSVLIRFISQEHGKGYSRFAYFLGDCQDAQINCCIAIHCDAEKEICSLRHPIPIQNIDWNS